MGVEFNPSTYYPEDRYDPNAPLELPTTPPLLPTRLDGLDPSTVPSPSGAVKQRQAATATTAAPTSPSSPAPQAGEASVPMPTGDDVEEWLAWVNAASYDDLRAALLSGAIPESVLGDESFGFAMNFRIEDHARALEARTWLLNADERIWQAISRWAV